MCETFPDLNCTDDFHLRLLLTRNPKRFFTLQDLETIITTENQLSLPSPTLVGLPVDEAGYQIILKGYAVPLVSLAITRLTSYECCEHGLFFQAFLEKELSQLDLRPWPLTADVYPRLTFANLAATTSALWNRDRLHDLVTDEQPYLYTLVDFLTEKHRPDISLAQWQVEMARNSSYWGWLERGLGTTQDRALFNTQWLGFIYWQAQRALPAAPLPAGTMQMSCSTDTGQTVLYEYQPQSDAWAATSPPSNLLQSVAGGYVYEETSGRGRALIFVRDNTPTVITTTATVNSYYTGAYPFLALLNSAVPENQFHFMSFNSFASDGASQNWLVDLNECTSGVCNPRSIPGLPIWSPDQQHILFYNDFFNEEGVNNIQLGDRQGQIISIAGLGQYPFWLDNSHYAYFNYDVGNLEEDTLTTELHIGHINGDPPQPLFTHADLLTLIPEITDSNHSIMIFGNARPGDHQEMSILVIPWNEFEGEPQVYVITLRGDEDWQRIETSYVTWSGSSTVIPSYSPDGRFQLFSNADGAQTGPVVTIRDLTDGAEQVIQTVVTGNSFFSSFPEWTEDGRWFIYVSNDELIFVNPYEKTEWRVPHALNQCSQMYYAPGEE
ncbi:MAG: hypothetical protein IPL78_14780 [Chloroflexi bacterium]|nr:hypothetical protein [Chloroflexota bacterium]